LIKEGQDLVNEYAEYEITCANAISKGIPGRTVFEETPEGGGELNPNVFYHGYEQDLSELATEWGMSGASADHPWWIDTGAAVWDFGVGAVEGTGAMLGMHSSEGWFAQSWGDSLKEYHWDNITSAAALVGMYDAESDSLGWTGGEGVKEAWKDLAHSVVPWEEWGDRPAYVIGTAALNIGAMVVGAGLTATGVGSVIGVPLMAWRGAAILDGMGNSGRGGSSLDADMPNIPDLPTFGGAGAPMVPIDLSKIDTGGFSPQQMNEIRASLDRIATEHGTGNDASAGGRPSQPRGGQNDPHQAQQRPVSAGEAHPDGARAGDLELFDRLISTPENQQFAQQVSQNHAGEVASVDRAAKTDPRGSSGSDEGQWTISELLEGGDPRTREPATTAPRHDSDSAHAQSSGPSNDQHLRQSDIEGLSSDANRSGERDPSANTPTDRSGDGPQARDHGPTASNNQSEVTAPPRYDISQDIPPTSRAGAEGSGGSSPDSGSRIDSSAEPNRTDRNDAETSSTRRDGDDSANDRVSIQPVLGPDGPDTPAAHRGGDDPNARSSSEGSERGGTREEPVSVPKTRDEAQAKAYDVLRNMDLGKGPEFVKNFVSLVNGNKYGALLERAFYNNLGYRSSADLEVNNQPVPSLTRASVNDPWVARDSLPPPLPPNYLAGEIKGTRVGVATATLKKLDKFANLRQISLDAYNPLNKLVKMFKADHKANPGIDSKQALEAARENRRPMGRMKTRLTEMFGERSAERAVRDAFAGSKVSFEEPLRDSKNKIVKDSNGNEVMTNWKGTLPELVESTRENPNPIPPSDNAPKNGNDQFDQIWRTKDGGFVIVEAKSSLGTELGERTVKTKNGELKRVSQGTREYFDDILKVMIKRGDPEKALAEEIRDTMLEEAGKVHYVEARGNPGVSGNYQGNSMKFFDIARKKS
jgi:hypothetical protein